MLNVNGHDQFMMLKFLHIAQFVFIKKLQSGKINQASLSLLPGYDTLPNDIIEDPAYSPTLYRMNEYKTCVENRQVIFNN